MTLRILLKKNCEIIAGTGVGIIILDLLGLLQAGALLFLATLLLAGPFRREPRRGADLRIFQKKEIKFPKIIKNGEILDKTRNFPCY